MPRKPFLTPEEEAMKRCEEMLYCKKQIQYWRNRYSKLERKHHEASQIVMLQQHADQYWHLLQNAFTKEALLAALSSESIAWELLREWDTLVPRELQEDPDIILKRLGRRDVCEDSNFLDRMIPSKFDNNKQFLLQVVEVCPDIVRGDSPRMIFCDLDIFSILMKKNSDAVIANWTKFDCGKIRKNRILLLSHVLSTDIRRYQDDSFGKVIRPFRNDESFLLDALKNFFEVFGKDMRSISQRLRAEKHVVLAFCRRHAGNLQHASYLLRRNIDVVREVCLMKSSPICPLHYCLKGDAKRELTQDKTFMLDMLKSYPCDEKLYRVCAKSLREDPDVFRQAILSKSIIETDIPDHIRGDREFWRGLIQEDVSAAWPLCSCREGDIDLASEAFSALLPLQEIIDALAARSLVQNILLHIPSPVQRRLFHSHIIDLAERPWLWYAFSNSQVVALVNLLPDSFLNDVYRVTRLCCHDYRIVELLPDWYWNKRTFISLVKYDCNAWFDVPVAVQVQCPEIVAEAIRSPDFRLQEMESRLPATLWQHREIGLAWASRGEEFLVEAPEEYTQDGDFMLLYAQHNIEQFWIADDVLLSDFEFMKKAVALNGYALFDANGDLSHNYELAMIAIAQNKNIIVEFEYARMGKDFRFLSSLARCVRTQLSQYDAFHRIFAPAVYFSDSSLRALHQGGETTVALLERIRMAACLSDDEKLRCLRKASANLLAWGF